MGLEEKTKVMFAKTFRNETLKVSIRMLKEIFNNLTINMSQLEVGQFLKSVDFSGISTKVC